MSDATQETKSLLHSHTQVAEPISKRQLLRLKDTQRLTDASPQYEHMQFDRLIAQLKDIEWHGKQLEPVQKAMAAHQLWYAYLLHHRETMPESIDPRLEAGLSTLPAELKQAMRSMRQRRHIRGLLIFLQACSLVAFFLSTILMLWIVFFNPMLLFPLFLAIKASMISMGFSSIAGAGGIGLTTFGMIVHACIFEIIALMPTLIAVCTLGLANYFYSKEKRILTNPVEKFIESVPTTLEATLELEADLRYQLINNRANPKISIEDLATLAEKSFDLDLFKMVLQHCLKDDNHHYAPVLRHAVTANKYEMVQLLLNSEQVINSLAEKDVEALLQQVMPSGTTSVAARIKTLVQDKLASHPSRTTRVMDNEQKRTTVLGKVCKAAQFYLPAAPKSRSRQPEAIELDTFPPQAAGSLNRAT